MSRESWHADWCRSAPSIEHRNTACGFSETQIPVLDKERELGCVLNCQVYKPGLHTSEELRWNYRIVITYKDIVSSTHSSALEKLLFPDHAAYAIKENLRWELVTSHYDLPIREINPHATD